jgi:hypothetical protein
MCYVLSLATYLRRSRQRANAAQTFLSTTGHYLLKRALAPESQLLCPWRSQIAHLGSIRQMLCQGTR